VIDHPPLVVSDVLVPEFPLGADAPGHEVIVEAIARPDHVFERHVIRNRECGGSAVGSAGVMADSSGGRC
jgi:hypothetical protein